jgi:hypothetical protein
MYRGWRKWTIFNQGGATLLSLFFRHKVADFTAKAFAHPNHWVLRGMFHERSANALRY